jgi:hypothetical protein
MAFEMKFRHRVVSLKGAGRAQKILLFDKPLRLGEQIRASEFEEYHLYRIRLRDLPGWPPRFLPSSTPYPRFSMTDSRLKSVEFKRRRSPLVPRVELAIEHGESVWPAFVMGVPILLLKCVEATLMQEGAAGKKLKDLQEMRLVSPD